MEKRSDAMKKLSQKVLKSAATGALKGSANSTSCVYIYQPKAPEALKKFSKIGDDK